eukprot:14619477-Ditylum_brightwellii.AAC.1
MHAGTITGSFQVSGSVDSNGRYLRLHLNDVQVVFDTMSLLRSTMKQVRHVVKKAMLTGGALANLLVLESGKTSNGSVNSYERQSFNSVVISDSWDYKNI